MAHPPSDGARHPIIGTPSVGLQAGYTDGGSVMSANDRDS